MDHGRFARDSGGKDLLTAESGILVADRALEGRPAGAEQPGIHIEATRGWARVNLRELWSYRELLTFFIWRDLKVRYKQTVLGAAWAIIQPILTMVVFSLFFGRLAKVPSDGYPYPIFNYAALIPWSFFSNALTQGSNSLVTSAHIIKKIYFPRILMPAATILAGIVDFGFAFVVYLFMMVYYDVYPTFRMLAVPGFLLLAVLASLGIAFWLSAMNVQFRDVRYASPFLAQAWLLATPIAYSSSLLSEPWRTLYGLNPMAGVVEGFRWALLGTPSTSWALILVSLAASVVLFISGLMYFRRMERSFADVI